MLQKR